MKVCFIDKLGDLGVLGDSPQLNCRPALIMAGIFFADSRNKIENVIVAHSVFTQKSNPELPRYQQIVERSTSGLTDSHDGIKDCDIVCSGLLDPIACFAHCVGHVVNVLVQPCTLRLRHRYGNQLLRLQFRYQNQAPGRFQGGLVVSDFIGLQTGTRMFR